MLSSNRNLLFLFAALAMAACLMVAAIVIYPDGRQMELGLTAAQPSNSGIARNQ
jgi:hypothetical protein